MGWPFDDETTPATTSTDATGGVTPPHQQPTDDEPGVQYESGDGPRLEDRELDTFQLNTLTPREIRIDFALCCICAGCPARSVKRELMRLCRMVDGDANRIITDAMRLLVDGFEAPKKALRYMSAAWYQMQLVDPNCPRDLKFKARQSLDTLLGIRDPVKHDADDDEDDSKRAARIERDEIRAALEKMPPDELKALHRAHTSIRDVVKKRSDATETPAKPPKPASPERNGKHESQTDTVSVPSAQQSGEFF